PVQAGVLRSGLVRIVGCRVASWRVAAGRAFLLLRFELFQFLLRLVYFLLLGGNLALLVRQRASTALVFGGIRVAQVSLGIERVFALEHVEIRLQALQPFFRARNL